MSDQNQISEARGLVQRLCTILRREEGLSSAATGIGSSGESARQSSGATSHVSRRDEALGSRFGVPPAIPSTSSPRETHQMLFSYQSSASVGVKKSRSLSLFSRGRSATYSKKPKKHTLGSHCFVWYCTWRLLLAANGLGKKKLQLFEQSDLTYMMQSLKRFLSWAVQVVMICFGL